MTAHRSKQQELERLGRALRTLSGSNRALLRVADEAALLHEICRVVVEEAGYRGAAVLRAEHDAGKSVTMLATAGTVVSLDDVKNLTWADSEHGQSASSIAIRSGQPCVVNKVDGSPLSPEWRELLRKYGFASVLSLPLRVDDTLFGALTIVAPEPDAFDEAEMMPLRETAADLAFGLHVLRARQRVAAAEETIRRMTYFDPVTGLPNRVQLRAVLGDAIAATRGRHEPLAVLRCEIDRYRDLEEALGCEAADSIMRAAAGRLKPLVQEPAMLAQIAEGEFAVVLPAAGGQQARSFAHGLLDALSEPLEVDGMLIDARGRIGISLFPGHGLEPETLLRRAGIVLGHARRSGSCVALYTGGLDVERGRHITLMADLRHAVRRGELRLFCQPKLHMKPRRLCGAEALVRWDHPTLGLLNPSEFVKLAEGAGLITPVTYWVLDAALRNGFEWRERGLVQPISVNLSAHDLLDPRLIDRVADQLATWGTPAGSVDFELTESALMEDPDAALNTLHALKRLDVSLTIDDFGTGYSSLSYLRKLPVDAIKIDQSFVRGMVADRDSATIVRSTIELAHNLDLEVIAEGVEDENTFTALADLGCDAAQGFCISQPMPVGDFAAWAGTPPH